LFKTCVAMKFVDDDDDDDDMQRGLFTVCPSVSPSLCQTRDLWQNRRKFPRFLYHSAKFSEEKVGAT